MEVFMNNREFSEVQIFQHSGKGIPLFMTGHKNCLQADYLLEPGPRLIKKKKFTGPRSQAEKHCPRSMFCFRYGIVNTLRKGYNK
jgi:hypothetical protein